MSIDGEITNWGARFYEKIRTVDLSPIYPQIIAIIRRSIVTNFRQGGRFGSGLFGGGSSAWKPSGRAIKQGGQTLRHTGLLLNSIQVVIERRSSAGFVIKLISNLPYAAIHHFGGQIKQAARTETFKRARKKTGRFKKMTAKQIAAQGIQIGMLFQPRTINIPARPYLVIQQADIEQITELIKRFYVQSLK